MLPGRPLRQQTLADPRPGHAVGSFAYSAPGIAMRVELTMTVPLYLDSPDGGGAMLYGDDGLPEPNGTG